MSLNLNDSHGIRVISQCCFSFPRLSLKLIQWQCTRILSFEHIFIHITLLFVQHFLAFIRLISISNLMLSLCLCFYSTFWLFFFRSLLTSSTYTLHIWFYSHMHTDSHSHSLTWYETINNNKKQIKNQRQMAKKWYVSMHRNLNDYMQPHGLGKFK